MSIPTLVVFVLLDNEGRLHHTTHDPVMVTFVSVGESHRTLSLEVALPPLVEFNTTEDQVRLAAVVDSLWRGWFGELERRQVRIGQKVKLHCSIKTLVSDADAADCQLATRCVVRDVGM